ncbi:MAG: creatininase family protein [Candidatus Omnitrophica bacterium]|nr:creatininase family protein [Candidatus Omnitrophota bacterium]
MKVNLMEMTLKEVRETGNPEVAILPWGSCECHNLHLPYGCDSLTVSAVAERSSIRAVQAGAKAVVLPTIPIGVNSDLFGFPLVLHLSPTTQLEILRDIVWSLEHHQIYKLLLINGHGGNNFKALAKQLYAQTKVRLFLCDWWKLVQEVAQQVCDDSGGEHGNEAETSWMIYLYPELVHLEWADSGQVKTPRLESLKKEEIWTARPWHFLTVNSGYGDPRQATFEKGEKIVEAAVEKISRIILELSLVVLDDSFPY